MAGLIYWMILQVLIGIWLAVSPYVFGQSGEMTTSLTTSNAVFGAVVALLGLGITFFGEEVCAGIEHSVKKTV